MLPSPTGRGRRRSLPTPHPPPASPAGGNFSLHCTLAEAKQAAHILLTDGNHCAFLLALQLLRQIKEAQQ